MTKTKNVLISVKGTQNIGENGPTQLELVTEGRYYKNGNDYFVTYKETEITGMDGTTTTMIIAESKNKITLIRTGSVNSQLIFEPGCKHVSYYDTINGAFTIGVFTNYMDVEIDEHGGEIIVDYLIEIDDSESAQNDFHMVIKEIKEKGGI